MPEFMKDLCRAILVGVGATLIVFSVVDGLKSYQDKHRITCLELNVGKETCDKIFNNKE